VVPTEEGLEWADGPFKVGLDQFDEKQINIRLAVDAVEESGGGGPPEGKGGGKPDK